MVVPSFLVVKSPPEHQGSVLGRIVAGDSRLGQLLYWIAFRNAMERSIAETRAEIAALRAEHHHQCDYPYFLTRYTGQTKGRKVYQTTYAQKGQGRYGRNNWCPTCKEYVAMSHDGPQGIKCKDYIKQRAQREAAHLAKMRATFVPIISRNTLTKPTWKDGTINTNRIEDRWIASIDQRALAIEVRLEEGQSPEAIAQQLEVSLASVERIKRALANLSAECCKPCEDAPKTRTQRKPKRHYVRHGAADLSFVRKQDLELATNL